MKKKLTPSQKEVLEVLKRSRWKELEVGPGLVEPRTAEALVRKGYCKFDLSAPWGDDKRYRVIRLLDEEESANVGTV